MYENTIDTFETRVTQVQHFMSLFCANPSSISTSVPRQAAHFLAQIKASPSPSSAFDLLNPSLTSLARWQSALSPLAFAASCPHPTDLFMAHAGRMLASITSTVFRVPHPTSTSTSQCA